MLNSVLIVIKKTSLRVIPVMLPKFVDTQVIFIFNR